MLKLDLLLVSALFMTTLCKWVQSPYFVVGSHSIVPSENYSPDYYGYMTIPYTASFRIDYDNIIFSRNYYSYSESLENSYSYSQFSIYLDYYDEASFYVYFYCVTYVELVSFPFTYFAFDYSLTAVSTSYCSCYGYSNNYNGTYVPSLSLTSDHKIFPILRNSYFQFVNVGSAGILSLQYTLEITSDFKVDLKCVFSQNYISFGFTLLVINMKSLQTDYNTFFDSGLISGELGEISSVNISSYYLTKHFFLSYSNFTINRTQKTQFTISNDGSVDVIQSPYLVLNASYFNFRTSACQPQTPYFVEEDQTCVQTCAQRFFANKTTLNCDACNYTCLQCQSLEKCTKCSEDDFRTESSGKCLCDDGYFDNNASTCVKCAQNCKVCTNATTCTTCMKTNVTYSFLGVNYNTTYVLAQNKSCATCTSLMTKCIACSAYNQCTTCVIANFSVSTDKKSCVCNTASQYFASSTNCTLCKDLILGCTTCSSNSTCTACDSTKNFVLSGGTCVCRTNYFLINSLCCHYTCSTCQNSSSTCTACSSTGFRTLASQSCPCNAKYYDSGVSTCSACMTLCATCNAANTCLTCNSANNLTLINNNCSCLNTSYVLMTTYCKLCSQIISKCLSCATNTTCKTCISPNYTLSSDNTSCPCNNALQYFASFGSCTFCSDLIYACTNCSSATACVSCISPNFTLSADASLCNCNQASNYFKKGGSCPYCSDLIHGCVTCSSNVTCSLCFADNYTLGTSGYSCDCNQPLQYFLWGTECPFCRDLIIGCTNCTTNSTCIQCDAVGFFRLEGDRCVCIDGYYLDGIVCLPCEVSCLTCVNTATFCLTCNNTALRIFGNNACDCLDPFSDCRTSGNDACDNRTCNYLKETSIRIVSMIKSPSQNSLTYNISLSPVITYFDGFNFDQIFNIGLPEGTNITFSYSNGYIIAEVYYYESMQGNMTDITLNLNQTGPWYFELAPQGITHYEIAPTNNLASNFYTQQLYDQREQFLTVVTIVAGLALIVYVIGLLSSKIAASEMIGIVQIAYIGLFIVNHSDPLINSLNNLEMANGINNLIDTTQQNTPNRIFSTGYTSSALSNLNIMLFVLILPPIASILFYVIHRKSTKYRFAMSKAWKLAIGEWYLSAFLFVLYNYSSSLITVFLFSDMSSTQFYFSVIEQVILSAIFGLLLWMFIKKDKTWLGQYKYSFNWNVFSGLYYLIPIFQRFLVGILITAGNMSFASGIIAVVVFVGCIVVVAVKKPFVKKYQNLRSILTNIYGVMIMGIYIALSINGPSKGVPMFTYAPYVIIVVVILNILTGFTFIILWFYKNCKVTKRQKSSLVQQTLDEKLHQDMSRNIQKMIKQVRKSNFSNRLLVNKVMKKNRKGTETPASSDAKSKLFEQEY